MIQLTKYGFRTSYDIDDMLYDDATWLAEQTTGSFKSFREIVERFELTDRYVGEFWKIVSEKRYKNDIKKRWEAFKRYEEDLEAKMYDKLDFLFEDVSDDGDGELQLTDEGKRVYDFIEELALHSKR